MKKTSVILFFIIMIVVIYIVYSFVFRKPSVGNNDWRYVLLNDYEIWHVNSETIVCAKKTSEHSLEENVGGNYVSEFCYDDKYICLQCIPAYGKKSDKTYKFQTDFYIIDSSTDTEYGPFTQDEFENKLSELNIIQLCSWIKTKPRPDGARFD